MSTHVLTIIAIFSVHCRVVTAGPSLTTVGRAPTRVTTETVETVETMVVVTVPDLVNAHARLKMTTISTPRMQGKSLSNAQEFLIRSSQRPLEARSKAQKGSLKVS